MGELITVRTRKQLTQPYTQRPTVIIVAALPVEQAAVVAALEKTRKVPIGGPNGTIYTVGEVPGGDERKHVVAVTFAGMGTNLATAYATRALNHFPTAKSVLMVGIAAGVPAPSNGADHVRLGDIVVSDQYGVVQHDFVKETAAEIIFRPLPRPPGARLLDAVRLLQADEIRGKRPWLKCIDRIRRKLKLERPCEGTDVLVDPEDPSRRLEHPHDPERIVGQPRVFVAPVGSGNTLLKDPRTRDELSRRFKVKAIEMEGSGIADAAWFAEIPYLVVRGISDYADSNKSDEWHGYAAVVAAGYTRALLQSMPAGGQDPAEDDRSWTPTTLTTGIPVSALSASGQTARRTGGDYRNDLTRALAALGPVLARAASAMNLQLEGLRAAGQTVPALQGTVVRRRDSVPMALAAWAPRDALVQDIQTRLTRLAWLTLIGSSGMGKSQLARAVYERHSAARKYWIALRNCGRPATSHLSGQLLLWYEECGGDARVAHEFDVGRLSDADLIQATAAAAGAGSLLVMDDLPQAGGDAVDHIAWIAAAFHSAGAHVLATGPRHPVAVVGALGARADELRVPLMDAADIASLVAAMGAPASLAGDRFCGLVLALTKGHPLLLTATLGRIARNGWRIDEEILRGAPLNAVKDDALRAAREFIPDEAAQELLYRLSLIGTSFELPMVTAVGVVPPPIVRPEERIRDLVGPWVEELEGARFQVSPLLEGVGEGCLSDWVQRAVHVAVARVHLRKRTVDVIDALHVLRHLHAAQDWLGLASILTRVLSTVDDIQQARQVDWAGYFFRPATPWPEEVPSMLRIMVRAGQVRMLLLTGTEVGEYDRDLEQLIQQAGPADSPAVAWALANTGPLLEAAPAAVAARRALRAARAFRNIEQLLPFSTPTSDEMMLLFWAAATKIGDVAEVEQVAEVIREMSREERAAVFGQVPGPEMALVLVDLAYGFEAEKRPEARDWERVLRALSVLDELGRGDEAEPLYAAALRGRAIVLADYLQDVDGALALVRTTCPQASDATRFLLAYTEACILLAHDRPVDAYEGFVVVLEMPGREAHDFSHREAERRASIAAARIGRWDEAIRSTARAIRTTRARERGEPYEELELLAELGWIHWQAGDRRRACAALFGVVRRLVTDPDPDSSRHKEVFSKIGHVLGWLRGVVSTGKPPETTAAGEPYTEPYPGMFSKPNPALAEFSHERRREILVWQFSQIAAGVGCVRIAQWGYEAAARLAKEAGFAVLAGMAEVERAPLEACIGNFRAAVSAAAHGAQALAIFYRDPQQATLDRRSDIGAEWRSLPQHERANAEAHVLFFSTLWTAYAALLEGEAGERAAHDALDRIEEAIGMSAARGELVNGPRWQDMADRMKLAFRSDLRRAELWERLKQLNSADTDNNYERTVLYLALSRATDARPDEVATAQAVVLASPGWADTSRGIASSSLARWIVSYWRREAAERGFRLSTPDVFRRELKAASNDLAGAARVLLAAEVAVSARFDQSVREQLVRITTPQGRATADLTG